MKVAELIEELENMDDKEMEVMFSYDYGDYWHTKVAKEVETVDGLEVEYSDYHSMYKIAKEPDEDNAYIVDDRKIVLILS